jgi:DNA-binding NarL/FixJ family response regulator
MSLFKRLLRSLGLYRDEEAPIIMHPLMKTIEELAYQEQRSKEAITADLLELALEQRHANEWYMQCWQSLTTREREVAALICLGYSNHQIATRLSISLSTTKTHVHNILQKFDLSRRTELQAALAHWDFAEWEQDNQ